MPSDVVVRVQKFRRWFREQVLQLFRSCDAIIAPATPCVAPPIGQATLVLDGETYPLRPNIGIYTQPISFIGLPVAVVPVPLQPLPIGVQITAQSGNDHALLALAGKLQGQRG